MQIFCNCFAFNKLRSKISAACFVIILFSLFGLAGESFQAVLVARVEPIFRVEVPGLFALYLTRY